MITLPEIYRLNERQEDDRKLWKTRMRIWRRLARLFEGLTREERKAIMIATKDFTTTNVLRAMKRILRQAPPY